MTSGLWEIGIEVLTLFAYVLISGILTYMGVLAEQLAVETFATGSILLAIWFLMLGMVALYGGVVAAGRDLLLSKLVDLIT
ncbi:hypothetical protein [Halolamina sp. C58]|uniref:hypothetical protein n=1 Tax=Halolamina sp. C58 TaxID=3421640 RepID=UPI003EBC3E54